MLIDLQNFEVEEVLEIIEDDKELDFRIDEAKDLLIDCKKCNHFSTINDIK
jgi:hypothetical protein